MIYRINGFLLAEKLDCAVRGEDNVSLSHQEQDALRLFLASEDGFVDTQKLEAEVWGEKVVTDNSLRKLISSLRLKFDDKDSFKNVRGKGYQLTFEVVERPTVENTYHRFPKFSFIVLVAACLIILLVIFRSLSSIDKIKPLPKISTQNVFESSDYILDYAIFDNALYVTARNSNTSKLYKTLNRQNTVLMSANYSGAYRGIEIHKSGRTILHVIEDGKCKIKVFERPVEELIDEIPCNRQNAFPSFDWIDESKFYITFNVNPSSSIKPYIYDLKTKQLEEVKKINFDSENGKKFIDSFIKAHGKGMFSLRQNNLDQMSLIYFEGDKRRTLYQYRAKPYSIAVSETNLYIVGNNNELLKINLTDDIYSQNLDFSLLLAPQTTKIDDPQILQDELYFSLGNTSKEVIYSTSGNFTYSLENGIRDFTYTDKVLSILALTNSGYVVEQLKSGTVVNTVYLDTKLSFRHIAFHQGELYLAGASGIYKLVGDQPILISELQTSELVSNGQCMIAHGENSIFIFLKQDGSFQKIAAQSERPFSSLKGCLFVDNLSGNIVNEKGEKIAEPTMNKLLFEHQGRITHWHSVGDKTHIVDIQTGSIIAKTDSRVLHKKVVSYEDDILYLSQADIHTSIVKVRFH